MFVHRQHPYEPDVKISLQNILQFSVQINVNLKQKYYFAGFPCNFLYIHVSNTKILQNGHVPKHETSIGA